MLHGWASHPINWTNFVKRLKAAGFKVLMPALPGFTTKISHPYNTQDYVDWFDGYLKDKNLDKIILIGQSFGGQIAIQFASQNPQKLERLVLIGAAGIRNQFNLKKNLFWFLAKAGKLVTSSPFFKKLLYRLAREWDYAKASPLMKETLRLIVKDDQQTNLRKVLTPTLLLWGSRDRYTPINQGQLMHRLIKGSTLKVFDGEGHGLHFTRATDLVKAITEFTHG